MKTVATLTAFFAILLAHQTAFALDAQQIFERVSPSVVVIKAGDSQGSGVVYAVDNRGLTPNSVILTNCHVVKGYTQVSVERLGKRANAAVGLCDSDRDMAVITLGGALPVVPVRTTPLKVGEPAFAVGPPQGFELSISQGIVSQLRPTTLGKDPMIQTTAAISKGSSGGGLFDSDGRLIGLTTLYYKVGQSLNFAVPISFVAASIVAVLKNSASSSGATSPKASVGETSRPQCGWTLLSERSDGEYIEYIDFCKITDEGRFRFAWILRNYAVTQRKRDGRGVFASTSIKNVYDCQLSRIATTGFHSYHGNMAQGAIVESISAPQNTWQFKDVPPGSMGEISLQTVCKL
jgi:Trypsin-like peptidase domain